MLTTTLSERLRVPVVTPAQPELAAAIGGGLSAARARVPDVATALAPAAPPPAAAAADPSAGPASSTFRALAWSQADDSPEPALVEPAPTSPTSPAPAGVHRTRGRGRPRHAGALVPRSGRLRGRRRARGTAGRRRRGLLPAARRRVAHHDGTLDVRARVVVPGDGHHHPSASDQPSAVPAPAPEQTVYQQAPRRPPAP